MESALRRSPDAQFVLDRLRLRQHLYDVVVHLGAKGNSIETVVDTFDWANGHGDLWRVILELRALVPPDPPRLPVASCPVADLIRYLERFEKCIEYDAFEQRGQNVRSGEVESVRHQVP